MSASLVGSEMCIRDRFLWDPAARMGGGQRPVGRRCGPTPRVSAPSIGCCLLYTSDAADDM
eukprot:7701797-Alexandrium_andersonii.AAC.1